MIVTITNLDHNGRGISKIDGKTCFIENALINEEVDIEITSEKKKYMCAKVKNIIKKSEDRVLEQCKYAKICGGCNIMHINYDKQIEFKINKIKEIFNKFCKININIDEFIKSEQLFYRNKITLHVSNKVGLYKEKTNEIIEVDNCLICNKKINEIYNILNKIDLKNIEKITIRSSEITNESMVIFDINSDIDIQKYKDLLINNVTTFIVKKNNHYDTIFGKGFIYEKLNDLIFKISPDSFFQVNTLGAQKLYSKVKEYLGKNNNVLDLYCGTGTIGIFISDISLNVVGIEINKYAVCDANENKKINNISNIKFICDDSQNVLKNTNMNFDAVIVDPPRSGLSKDMINSIFKIEPKKIIYVSCDPITLARDVNLLIEKYDFKKISLVDMFPNTSHVESVVLLEKM